jgi:hypothetical protein
LKYITLNFSLIYQHPVHCVESDVIAYPSTDSAIYTVQHCGNACSVYIEFGSSFVPPAVDDRTSLSLGPSILPTSFPAVRYESASSDCCLLSRVTHPVREAHDSVPTQLIPIFYDEKRTLQLAALELAVRTWAVAKELLPPL